MTKFTETKKYEMIIDTLKQNDLTAETAMLVDFCETKIAAIAAKAEKAKERRAAKAKEADPVYDAVYAALSASTADHMTIKDILSVIGDDSLSSSKITPRLTTMVDNDLVTRTTVTTEDKRRVQGYSLVK